MYQRYFLYMLALHRKKIFFYKFISINLRNVWTAAKPQRLMTMPK